MITSTANPKIKQIRKLRDRKERQQSGLAYVEGLRLVGEALQLDAHIEELIVSPELLESGFGKSLVEQAAQRGIAVLEVSGEVFASLAMKDGPQGIAALVQQKWGSLQEIAVQEPASWVALDAVQDPGNLGTILRTHDAVGGRGVILLDQGVDGYDPAAIRASMGSIFSQTLVRVSFQEFAEWKRRSGVAVVGAAGSAKASYRAVHYPRPLVLLMGSERLGLQEHHLKICDEVVSIPMVGRSDSLNLSVATSIILYEIFHQWADTYPQPLPKGKGVESSP